jgi:predicted phage terminase large subunit-like protein
MRLRRARHENEPGQAPAAETRGKEGSQGPHDAAPGGAIKVKLHPPTPEHKAILRAQRGLWDFVRYIYPEPLRSWNWHHKLICDYIDQLIDGEIDRLMIFTPPRHGKSEIVSRLLPAYAFGRHPEWALMACSHTADLSQEFNKDVQAIMDSPRYRDVFPDVRLPDGKTRDGKAKARNLQRFQLIGMYADGEPFEGEYNCAGVGGAIVGRGFNLGIIDDPVKSEEVMESVTQLKKLYRWYDKDFMSRRQKDARILIMHQRRGLEDLAGYLIDKMIDGSGDRWVFVNLPAEYEAGVDDELVQPPPEDPRQPGELLWPEFFDADYFSTPKKDEEIWATLYQQKPRGAKSKMFDNDAWRIVEALPRADIIASVRFWDLSGTEKGDPWAGTLMYKTRHGLYYVEDCNSFQAGPAEGEGKIENVASQDGRSVPIDIEEEKGASGKHVTSHFQRLLAGYIVQGVPVSGTKAVRAKPYSIQQCAGNVLLVRGLWNTPFMAQHKRFTGGKGKKDDMVDSASGAFAHLAPRKQSTGKLRTAPRRLPVREV